MKPAKLFLIATCCLFFANVLAAQTAVLSFVNPTVIGNKFRVTIRAASAGGDFGLGNTNFRFDYPSSVLSNVTVVSNAFPTPFFKASTTQGTAPATGICSINTAIDITVFVANCNVTPVPATGTNLVVLEWDIVNPNASVNLNWRITGANPRTTLVDDDKLTPRTVSSSTNLTAISLASLSPLTVSPNVTTTCQNPTATLTASGGFGKYLWSTGETTASITVNPSNSTTYLVTATSINTSTNVTVSVNKTPPTVNAGSDVTMSCDSTSITLTATGNGASYLWSNGETLATIIVSPTITTTYGVTATAANGCTADDSVMVTIQNCASNLVGARVMLNQMSGASLSSLSNFPHADPYANGAFNGKFTHVNNSTIATISQSALNVTGNNAIIDWLFLELRNGTSGSTSVVYTKSVLLQADGDIVDVDGVSPVNFRGAAAGSYYIAVRHRNNLGFRTANKIAISSTLTSLDFTSPGALHGAYALTQIAPNVYAMNGGDSDSDGSIDAFDTIVWETQNGLFDDYTNNADYNMDGSVDAFDTIIWELNNGKFQELD